MNKILRLANRLLDFFGGNADLEDLKGDLSELFKQDEKKYGRFIAKLRCWKHTFSLLRSYALIRRKSQASYSSYYSSNIAAVFKNYLKISIRNFARYKLFTVLNVFGLALGMSISLIALTVSVSVYQIDEFHEKKTRLFQVNTRIEEQDQKATFSSTFHASSHYLDVNYPFIEKVVDIRSGLDPKIDHHGQEMELNGYYAGEHFFEVFTFQMLQGNKKTALRDPMSVVLTKRTARKLFRDKNPLGETIESELGRLTVTGVMDDLHQTHFYFDLLVSYSTFEKMSQIDLKNDWEYYRDHYTYVLLQEGSSQEQLEKALLETSQVASLAFTDRKVTMMHTNISEIVPHKWYISNSLGVGWDQAALVFFIVIGLLILLPAIFNYTNLSIARSLRRAKEIGIRKVMGVRKGQIRTQFVVETILMTLLALILSFVIMIPLKEAFMEMVYFTDVVDTDVNSYQVITFICFAVLVGLFAGIFPAIHFSRLNPTQTLKGDVLNQANGVTKYKKGLFVFQFFMSLVLLIGVAAIGKQYTFILNNNYGFKSANTLCIPFNGMNKRVLLNEVSKHQDILSATATSHIPGLRSETSVLSTPNEIDTLALMQIFIGDDYVEQMDMQFVWGDGKEMRQSNLSEQFVLVNQEYMRSVRVLNKQQDSLRFTLEDGTKCRIVGILKDFNFEPVTELISPLVFRYSLADSHFALLSVNSSNMKRTMAELDEIWNQIDESRVFNATFLNDEIEDAYSFMLAQIKFFSVLSILAISISCMGLLGMISFSTENRTKEIAVRKIMGATNVSLYYMLTKDFLKLIGLSTLLAVPFSYVFYDKIFLKFLIKYDTGLSPWDILMSVGFLFLVGAVSIYGQTSKVTKANPSDKLRYE
ncbi:MAG: FtsX-like permease family protein [Bacteroidota bacterium]